MSVFKVEGNSFRAEDLASHNILKITKDSKVTDAIKLIKNFVRNGNTFFLSQPELVNIAKTKYTVQKEGTAYLDKSFEVTLHGRKIITSNELGCLKVLTNPAATTRTSLLDDFSSRFQTFKKDFISALDKLTSL